MKFLLLLVLLLAGGYFWPDMRHAWDLHSAESAPPVRAVARAAFALPPNHGQTYAVWRQTQPAAKVDLFAPHNAPLLHAIQNSLYQIPAYRGQSPHVVGDIRFSRQQVRILLESADNPHVRDSYRWQADTGWKYERPERLFRRAIDDRRVPLHTLTFALVPSLYADARQHNQGLYQESVNEVSFQAGTKRTVEYAVGETHVGFGLPTLWVVRLIDDRSTRAVFYDADGHFKRVD